MAQKRLRVVLSGKVQGVFFRDFAKQNANKIGVYGYVRNLKNGDVEIVARGEGAKVEQFLKICELGPMMANIRAVSREEIPLEEGEEDYFDIRYG